jgi:excinuclease ABC subunit C
VIQQLRDEAHRFGITFHRKKRDKGTLVTELDLIEGIGKTTSEKLLKYFKSVKKVREATVEELMEIVNTKQAKSIAAYFEGK